MEPRKLVSEMTSRELEVSNEKSRAVTLLGLATWYTEMHVETVDELERLKEENARLRAELERLAAI